MADLEKELDATLKATEATLAEAERLIETAEALRKDAEEWRKTHAIPEGATEKLFGKLSPDDQKKFEEEKEKFEREVAHDMEEVERQAKIKAGGMPSPGAKRRRDMA